jgi:hypothetical protein
MAADIIIPERFRPAVALALHRQIADACAAIIAKHPTARSTLDIYLALARVYAGRGKIIEVNQIIEQMERSFAFEPMLPNEQTKSRQSQALSSCLFAHSD